LGAKVSWRGEGERRGGGARGRVGDQVLGAGFGVPKMLAARRFSFAAFSRSL
jgi:hypothetical protein